MPVSGKRCRKGIDFRGSFDWGGFLNHDELRLEFGSLIKSDDTATELAETLFARGHRPLNLWPVIKIHFCGAKSLKWQFLAVVAV